MSKGKNVIKVGDLEFAIETLIGSTGEKLMDIAKFELWDFSSIRWNWSEEKREYQIETVSSRHELTIFTGNYKKMFALLASDRNGVFEKVSDLFEFLRDYPEDFDRIYNSIIKINPTLIPEEKVVKDPNLLTATSY